MNSSLLIGLALSLPLGAPQLKDPPPKMPSIAGDWFRVGHLQAGERIATDKENHRQVFTPEGEWEYYYQDRKGVSGRMTYMVDAKQNPPTIDIYSNPARAEGWRGIYKIEGETLTLCLVNTPGERPKTFESSADRPTTVWVFKRTERKD